MRTSILEISQKAGLKSSCNEGILQGKRKTFSKRGQELVKTGENEQFNLHVNELSFHTLGLSYKVYWQADIFSADMAQRAKPHTSLIWWTRFNAWTSVRMEGVNQLHKAILSHTHHSCRSKPKYCRFHAIHLLLVLEARRARCWPVCFLLHVFLLSWSSFCVCLQDSSY